ncbi:MAG: 2-hydroxychromene-2-carboxylate isomerase [Pacificimonas sp.]
MAKTVELLFDFVSPNGYLAWYPLKDIVARTGAELTVTPVFLGGIMKLTGNQPPMIANAGVKGKNDYMMLEIRRFVAKHGLTNFSMNPHFPMMSIAVQRMLVHAARTGRAAEMIDHVLPHVWERGADIADPAVLQAIFAGSAFDADELAAVTGEDGIKAELTANTEAAVARGVFGLPSMFVGSELFFGKDSLGGVEDALS